MEKSGCIIIFITASDHNEANKMAEHLLDRRKIACANVIPKVNSLFWWQGKIESEEESLLVIKTKASVLSEIIDLVKEVHSYEVPEIIALPIIGGNEEYLRWIIEEVEG